MTSQLDIKLAYVAVQEELADTQACRQRMAACGDEPLRTLLGRIERRKSRHVSRLLSWLQQHSPGLEHNLKAQWEASLAGPPTAAPANEPQRPEMLEAETSAPGVQTASAPPLETGKTGYPVQIMERRNVTDDLLIIKVPRPANYAFVPGQAAKLTLDGIKRDYSIVSAPHEPFLEFFIELVPGGPMSERLRKLDKGHFLTLGTRPKGKLTLDSGFPNQFMIATVTGVNPFISILRAYLHERRRGQRFYLLHGASYQDEFGYKDELERIAAAHPEVLTYIPTVSRPDEDRNAGWTGERGRVDTLIAHYLSRFGLDNSATVLYACGNPGMVDEVERRFTPQDFEIKVERYF